MDRDSPVLAWQERVVRSLAGRCARVVVLTEHVGAYQTAPNLVVHAVPQLFCRAPLRSLGAKWLLAGAVARWCRREQIEACFFHMNHEWSYRLRPVLRHRGVPTLLWYAHGGVHPRLRRSHRCVDAVVTSSPEGFRIPSDKVTAIGQAIDTDLFQLQRPPRGCAEIVAVGRIAARKNLRGVLDAFAALCALRADVPFRLRVVGPTLPGDEAHARELRDHAAALGIGERITWTGALPQSETALLYARAFLHLSLSRTGSMDKTVLEALACGCPALTSNEAFRDLLREHPQLRLTDEPAAAIARRIEALYRRPAAQPEALRALVVGSHDLSGYVERILAAIDDLLAARPVTEALEVERVVAR